MPRSFAPRRLAVALVLCLASLATGSRAHAEDGQSAEAATHFQRGVQLYAEADYRAALVEFRRAYDIAPNITVLYNIGESYYQLQNYAGALDTFQKFLAEGGSLHRADVESAVAILKTRVGKVDVATSTPGWEIAIDDEPVGKTPLPRPLSVSIGHRRITASIAGQPSQAKFVDVAAGETRTLSFDSAASGAAANGAGRSVSTADAGGTSHGPSSELILGGWIATGALAAGAITFGALAIHESSQLKDARKVYPANTSDIDSKSSSTLTLSIVADALGASAIVLGGVSLYFTLTKPSATSSTSARLGLAGNRMLLEGTF